MNEVYEVYEESFFDLKPVLWCLTAAMIPIGLWLLVLGIGGFLSGLYHLIQLLT